MWATITPLEGSIRPGGTWPPGEGIGDHNILAQECDEGRVLGPFEEHLLPQLHVRRLGVVPKSISIPGQWRLIVDLSSPEGHSVNDGISSSLCSLLYVSMGMAVEIVVQKGRGALLAKVDIQSAYRMLPIHPEDR